VSFRPVDLTRPALRCGMRYSISQGRVVLAVSAGLYKACKCGTKPVASWSLELGEGDDAGKALLRCLPDEGGQKKHNPRMDDKSLSFWFRSEELARLFPDNGKTVALSGAEVTPAGIVFKLPELPKKGGKA
jgi:hypothetical protein